MNGKFVTFILSFLILVVLAEETTYCPWKERYSHILCDCIALHCFYTSENTLSSLYSNQCLNYLSQDQKLVCFLRSFSLNRVHSMSTSHYRNTSIAISAVWQSMINRQTMCELWAITGRTIPSAMNTTQYLHPIRFYV